MNIERENPASMSPADKPGGGEELKFEPLTLGQTLAKFDTYKAQQSYSAFVSKITSMFSSHLRAFEKDKNLPVLIVRLLEEGRDPLVDKHSRLVFDGIDHGGIRSMLYSLYENLPTDKESVQRDDVLSRQYREKGLGYYWSSTRRQEGMNLRPLPIGHDTFKPDRIDKETWDTVLDPNKRFIGRSKRRRPSRDQ
ncbi:hypothetical protein HY968_03140 [Candidatus Kaiserbacteria bacterium]|nr:hypothetical protein [Candidatus Kaiserbacteria bacterium]